MIILGITYLSHDSSAALIVDGKVIAIAEEERFSRKKHDNGFPAQAIQFVLKQANITADQIDIVALPYQFFNSMGKRIAYGLRNLTKAKSFLIKNLGHEVFTYLSFEDKILGEFKFNDVELRSDCKIQMYEHHLCHASSTYLSSAYDQSLIISWDGRGEWPCILYALAEGDRIQVIDRCYFPHSIGQVYQAATQYLGFSDIGDEYKVMGLAPYGSPKYLETFKKILQVDGWNIQVDQSYSNYHIYNRFMADRYSMQLEKELGPARHPSEGMDQRHQDIAASIQERVNQIGIQVANALKKAHPHIKNLCITGGVAQNIIMNQRIYEHAEFDQVFVGPSSYDGGLSLGAALLAAHDAGAMKDRFVMEHGSWGKGYSTQEICNEVENCGLIHAKPQDVIKTAATLLSQGCVLGWFQGRAEFGPRALGHRSILADPRKAEMKETVNRKIKFREEFRPFAPSVLEEKFTEYFDGCPVNPFMTFSARVRSSASPIPGVTHVDNSARPQAVRKSTQPQYWSLIKAFEEITSVPVLLNTSFNVKGEPIVNSPTDAIRCFFSTGIDYLILENVIVSKKNDLSNLTKIEK